MDFFILQHYYYSIIVFLMYRSIETLTKSNIKVFSIKADALTIKNDDLDLAQQLLDFEPGLGKWRHSKTGKDIIFPTKPLEKRITNLTQLPQKNNNNSSFKYSRRI